MTITKYAPEERPVFLDVGVYKLMVINSRQMTDDQLADYINQIATGVKNPLLKKPGDYKNDN